VIKTVFLAARSGGCFKRHGFRGEVAFVNWNQSTRAERQALALTAPPWIDCYPASSFISSTPLRSPSICFARFPTGDIPMCCWRVYKDASPCTCVRYHDEVVRRTKQPKASSFITGDGLKRDTEAFYILLYSWLTYNLLLMVLSGQETSL
jgi:hypothetical protein